MTAVTSYTELIGAIRDRVGQLGLRYEDFDDLAGFASGLSGKVFGPAQVKRLGIEKVFDAMCASGLRFRIEEDPEQAAKMIQRIAENYNPRQANQARMQNNASPVGTALMSRVFKHMSRLGNNARQQKMTKAERSASAKHAARMRWLRHRKRVRAAMKAAKTRKNRMALMEMQNERDVKTLDGYR